MPFAKEDREEYNVYVRLFKSARDSCGGYNARRQSPGWPYSGAPRRRWP